MTEEKKPKGEEKPKGRSSKSIAIAIIVVLIIIGLVAWQMQPKPAPMVTETSTEESIASSEAMSFAGQTLKVVVWSGVYEDDVNASMVKPFEEMTGAKIDLVGGWVEIADTIIAAPADNPPYDVAIGEGYVHTRGLAAGIWLPINYDHIPNMKNIFPYYNELDEYDHWKGYAVPYASSITVIGYNEKALGFTPTSWKDLWRPEVQGKIALDGAYWNFPVSIGAIIAGKDFNTPEGVDAGIKELQKLKVAVWYQSGADYESALLRGDVDMVQGYSGDMWRLAADKNAPQISEAIPSPTTGWVDYFHIVRGTKNVPLAEAFINFALSKEAQTKFAEGFYGGYWAASSEANPAITGDGAEYYPRNDTALRASLQIFNYTYWNAEWTNIEERMKKEVWVTAATSTASYIGTPVLESLQIPHEVLELVSAQPPVAQLALTTVNPPSRD